MGIVITSDALTNSFTIELNGLSSDRDKARIKLGEIRSLVKRTDGTTVEIIFSNGEIYGFPHLAITSIDGLSVTSQEDLYSKMENIIFL